MKIHGLMKTSDDGSFFEENFQIILESHIPYLKGLDTTFQQMVENHQAFKYEGDFFGLLLELGVIERYHFITMRINNLRCPGDYRREMNILLIPSFEEIDLLNSIYRARKVAT